MMGSRRQPPEPDTIAGLNITFLVFILVAVLGTAGGVLAISPYEPPYKIALFMVGSTGTTGSFFGLRKFHLRRVVATGDPRTTIYSAFAIYSSLFFSIIFSSIAFLIFGREYGWISEDFANFVSYFLITDVIIVLFLLGVACVWDMARPGVLARRIYLWPWSYLLESFAGREPDVPDHTRNDADHNPKHYDAETDDGPTTPNQENRL